jgi:hypothetical protein
MCSIVPSTGRPVDEVLGDRRRLIVGARDLLHDDAALAIQLIAVDPRPADEVGQEIRRFGAALRTDGDVERDEIVARVRVQHRPDPLGRLVDVAVGGVLLAALEDEVLQKMGHPVLLGALGPRAGVERDQQRQRARTLDADPVQRQAVLEGRRADLRHRQECSGHGRAQRSPVAAKPTGAERPPLTPPLGTPCKSRCKGQVSGVFSRLGR